MIMIVCFILLAEYIIFCFFVSMDCDWANQLPLLINVFTAAGAIVAAFAAISTLGDTKEATKQVTRQAQAAMSANRAWIDFDLALSGGAYWSVNGFNILYEINLRNIGHSPASSVDAIPILFIDETRDLVVELKNECEPHRNSVPASRPIGQIIFPGQSFKEKALTNLTRQEMKDEKERFYDKNHFQWPQGLPDVIYLAICVVYNVPEFKEKRITARLYELLKSSDGHLVDITPGSTEMRNDLILRSTRVGDYAD